MNTLSTNRESQAADSPPQFSAFLIPASALIITVVAWCLYYPDETVRMPPQTSNDYGTVFILLLVASTFLISVWQIIWLGLAVVAKRYNSITLSLLVNRWGTKSAKALISTSVALVGICGVFPHVATEVANASPVVSTNAVYTGTTSDNTSKSPISTPKEQQSEGHQTSQVDSTVLQGDLNWGADSVEQSETTQPVSYTIQEGDSLWKIARNSLTSDTSVPSNKEIYEYVQTIYKTNKDKIGPNPNLIFPGISLELPVLSPVSIHIEEASK